MKRVIEFALVLSVLAVSAAAHADAVQDATTRAKIETALLYNEHLNPFEIKAKAADGMITLNGAVQTQVQKNLAESVAKSVVGVKQVVNNIRVASASPAPETRAQAWTAVVNDATVTASVLTRLSGVKGIDPARVNVTTEGGAVTLSGTVESEQQRDRVTAIAGSTRGVRTVNNNLRIAPQDATTRPSRDRESTRASRDAYEERPEEARREQRAPAEEALGLREERRLAQDEYGVREERRHRDQPGEGGMPMARVDRDRAEKPVPHQERRIDEPQARVGREMTEHEREYRDRMREAQRLRQEADERRQEARAEVRERQQEFREEYSNEQDADRLSDARMRLRQDIAEVREEADRDVAELEREAQVVERQARDKYAEARREAPSETKVEKQAEEGRVSEMAAEARARAEDIGETVSDEWLEKRIELDLALNDNVDMGELDVEVNNGVATLSGTVKSEAERRVAASVADSIKGIKQVRNNIQLSARQ